jgi:hypothetical protein
MIESEIKIAKLPYENKNIMPLNQAFTVKVIKKTFEERAEKDKPAEKAMPKSIRNNPAFQFFDSLSGAETIKPSDGVYKELPLRFVSDMIESRATSPIRTKTYYPKTHD